MSNETLPFDACSPKDTFSKFGGEAGRSSMMEGSDWDHLYFFSKRGQHKTAVEFLYYSCNFCEGISQSFFRGLLGSDVSNETLPSDEYSLEDVFSEFRGEARCSGRMKGSHNGVWNLVGLRVGEIPQRRDDAHASMQWYNSN